MPTAEYTVADQERMSSATNYFRWQSDMVTRELGRRVVEVGCGIGNFTHMLLDREAVFAIDIEPDCIERHKERYAGHPNIRAFAGDGATVLRSLRRYEPDSCVCLNVLEHIEDDHEALSAMAAAVVPGGVIVLLVPAFMSLYGPIDRNLGHYRRYSRSSLTSLAQAVGLRVRKLRYVNTVGFFGWWTNSHILKREAQSEGQIKLFDSVIVPVMSKVESVVPPPFGQSLFAVLERP
jgi:SAM-dependent methyltransferase